MTRPASSGFHDWRFWCGNRREQALHRWIVLLFVIFGDDLDRQSISAYARGVVGRRPNIDSIAKTGILFTDRQPRLLEGKTEKSARREFFDYGETGRMAVGVVGSKMHIGVKPTDLCRRWILSPTNGVTPAGS